MSVSIAIKGADFSVTKMNKDGDPVETTTIHAEKPFDHKKVATILGTIVKSQGTARHAALSFLAEVYKHPVLDGFRLQGDKSTGKVSKEYKAAVRSAEEAVVREMWKDGSLKLKDEPAMQQWVGALREDKNYSNAKVTTSRFVAFVAESLITKDGYIIPIEIQKEQINEAIDRAPQDNSLSAKLQGISEFMGKVTLDDLNDIKASLGLAKGIVATLEGILNQAAALSTGMAAEARTVAESLSEAVSMAPPPVNIPEVAQQALAKAAATAANVTIAELQAAHSGPKASKAELIAAAAKAQTQHKAKGKHA